MADDDAIHGLAEHNETAPGRKKEAYTFTCVFSLPMAVVYGGQWC